MESLKKVEQCGKVKIITFAGGKRSVETLLASQLDGQTDAVGESHLLLDFSHVECLSSEELATLIRLHKQLKASGGRLTLFNLCAPVFEVFRVTKLNKVLRICREQDSEETPPLPSERPIPSEKRAAENRAQAARVLAFDVDPATLLTLCQALPEWQIQVVQGASVASLAQNGDIEGADLLPKLDPPLEQRLQLFVESGPFLNR